MKSKIFRLTICEQKYQTNVRFDENKISYTFFLSTGYPLYVRQLYQKQLNIKRAESTVRPHVLLFSFTVSQEISINKTLFYKAMSKSVVLIVYAKRVTQRMASIIIIKRTDPVNHVCYKYVTLVLLKMNNLFFLFFYFYIFANQTRRQLFCNLT